MKSQNDQSVRAGRAVVLADRRVRDVTPVSIRRWIGLRHEDSAYDRRQTPRGHQGPRRAATCSIGIDTGIYLSCVASSSDAKTAGAVLP